MPVFEFFAGATTPPDMPGEVMPLVGYSPFWLWLGIGIVVLVAVFYVLAMLFTRQPRDAPVEQDEPEIDLEAARIEAFARVDEVERLVASGELDDRTAYERLSRAVREFAAESTGVPADHMTLSDLSHTQLHGTTRTVAQLYPGIFAPDAQRNVAAAVHDARAVISGWN